MILQSAFQNDRDKIYASQEEIKEVDNRYAQGQTMEIQQQEAGFFEGIGEAWKGLPAGALKSVSLLEEVAANTGLSHINPDRIDQEDAVGGFSIEDAEKHQEILRVRLESDAKAHREEADGRFGIKPETVGMAGQVLYGLAETLPKAIAANVVAGPVGGAAMFGGDYGGTQYLELRDKGVDKKTAAMAGAVSGIAGAVGVWLPATFGKSRVASATIGALANIGLTSAELGAVGWILDRQNYEDLAEQYGLNVTSVVASGFFGGVFGGAMWRPRGRLKTQAEPTPHFDKTQRKTVGDSIYEQLKVVGGEYADDTVARTQADLHATAVENISRVYDVPFENVEAALPRIVRDDGSLDNAAFKQIIGTKGADSLDFFDKGNRIDALGIAKQMEGVEGTTAKEIKLATGWERGADGKWRYEIPDAKWIDAMPDDGTYNLGELVDAPELFAAYPFLRRMQVVISKRDDFEGGYYHNEDAIVVNNKDDFLTGVARSRLEEAQQKRAELKAKIDAGLSQDDIELYEIMETTPDAELSSLDDDVVTRQKAFDELKKASDEFKLSVLIHEMQHAIQVVEGFARGGNPDMFPSRSELVSERRAIKDDLVDVDSILEYQADLDLSDDSKYDYRPFSYYKKKKADFEKRIAEIDAELENFVEPFERYKRLMGEVEARNVMERMKLDEQERRQKLLAETEDISREDQVFLNRNGEDQYSANKYQERLWHVKSAIQKVSRIVKRYLDGKSTNGQGKDSYEDYLVVSDRLVKDLGDLGLDVSNYKHTIIDNDVKHAFDKHGVGNEKDPNQVPITEEDLWRIPLVVEGYDSVELGGLTRTNKLQAIKYTKIFEDGVQIVVEEMRKGRKKLAFHTAYKKITPTQYASRNDALPSAQRPKRAEVDLDTDILTWLKGSFNQENRGSYNPATREIKLTPKANLSTFSHEMGHWYLDTMMSMSGRGSALLTQDIDTLLREFGVKSVEDWNALGVEGQRKYHEQFASWLEVYLSKGEAPNPSLKDVLARVAQWIVDVYESFGGTKKAVEGRFESEFGTKLPEMSDEVKAVMDRLFAEQKANRKMAAKKPTTEQVAAGRVVLQSSTAAARIQKLLKKDPSKLTAKDARDMQNALRASDIAVQQMSNGQAVDVANVIGDAEIDESVMKESRGNFAREYLMGGDDSQAVVLQNRDRDTVASVGQMNRIAAKPDYLLASFSRMLQDGAPIVSFGTMPDNAHLGKGDFVVGPNNRRIPVQYAVVEADSVLTSNDYLGNANPSYGDASKVNAVAGNGRATGIAEAYNRGTAEQYKADMIADAQHGIDPEVITAMKKPMLVRFIGKDEVTTKLIDDSNKQSTLARSPVELAVDDAKLISRNVDSYEFDEDGLPTEATVQQFVNDINEPNALGRLITRDGNVTPEAVARVQNAVVQAAYGDLAFSELVAMETKPGAKRLMNALVKAAPKFVEVRKALGESYDFSRLLLEGFKKVRESMRAGQDSVLQSGSIFGDNSASAFIDMLDRNRNSMAGVMRELDLIFDAIKQAQESAGGMFGGEMMDLPEILSRVRQAQNEARLSEGKPLLMDIDAEEMRQGLKAAQELKEAVESQARALEAQQMTDTQAVDPVERSRQMLTKDADAARVSELAEEMPDILFDIDGPDGKPIKMSAADIAALNESELARAETEAVSMGEVFACVDLNRGIE